MIYFSVLYMSCHNNGQWINKSNMEAKQRVSESDFECVSVFMNQIKFAKKEQLNSTVSRMAKKPRSIPINFMWWQSAATAIWLLFTHSLSVSLLTLYIFRLFSLSHIQTINRLVAWFHFGRFHESIYEIMIWNFHISAWLLRVSFCLSDK